MTFDPRELRSALGSFATGVTVVSVRQSDGTPRGFTANSFTSVSLEPPLLLICIAKSAHSLEVFQEASSFAVNILSDTQREVSGLFASQAANKFDLVDWQSGKTQAPLISGSLAHFECLPHQFVDAGDHVILIGKIEHFVRFDGTPLGYFRGNYFDLGQEQPLLDAVLEQGRVKLGCIVSKGSHILLAQQPEGRLTVPYAPKEDISLMGLRRNLAQNGLRVDIDFLYAVFNDEAEKSHGIFYHGSVQGEAAEGYAYFPLSNLPLDRVQDKAERSALARYAEEHRHGSFGVYHGNETHGMVQTVSGKKKSSQ